MMIIDNDRAEFIIYWVCFRAKYPWNYFSRAHFPDLIVILMAVALNRTLDLADKLHINSQLV